MKSDDMSAKKLELLIRQYVDDVISGSIKVLLYNHYKAESESIGDFIFKVENKILTFYDRGEQYSLKNEEV